MRRVRLHTIYDNIPIPRLPLRGAQRPEEDLSHLVEYNLMAKMEPGQSFFVDDCNRHVVQRCIQALRGGRPEAMFVTRRIPDRQLLGVWRVQ